MLQNPNTISRRGAAAARRVPGNLKRDINLLPANENSEKIAHWGTLALAVLMGALLLTYFAILLPGSHLSDLQNQADSLDSQ